MPRHWDGIEKERENMKEVRVGVWFRKSQSRGREVEISNTP